jgi:riboflavin synthase
MFTGLVQERGTVADIVRNDTSAVITIKAAHLAGQIKPGDSVSVDGVCLTAVDVASDSFTADVMVQTLERDIPWSNPKRKRRKPRTSGAT